MKKNVLNRIIFALTLTFSVLLNIKAFPASINITAQGGGLTLNNSLSVVTGVNRADATYPWFHVKNSNEGRVVCLSGLEVPAPTSGTCTKTNWSNSKDGYVLGYIAHIMGNGTSNGNYYFQELLGLEYLGKLNKGEGSNFYNYIYGKSGITHTIESTGKTFAQILTEAQNYANNVSEPSITVNNASTAAVTFTKNEDGYYYSNTVSIRSSENYTLGTPTNSKFSVDNLGGNKYRFKIKSSDIALGGKEEFKSTTTITKTYYVSAKYVCGSGLQDIALAKAETETYSASITISGSVTKENATVEVEKVDEKGSKLANAKFMLQTEAFREAKKDGIIKSTDGQSNIKFTNLTAGKYYLTEMESPKGYNENKKVYEIVIDNDGKILVDGKESNGIIKIKNTKTKAVISKKSVVNSEELPGAKLQILNEKQEKMSCVILDKDGKEQKLDDCSWTSGEESTTVVGLLKGKYYLKETLAPKGYVLNENMVEFEIKADGTPTNVEMLNELEVEVPDTLSSKSSLLLAIAMFDIAVGIGIVTYVKKNKIEQ